MEKNKKFFTKCLVTPFGEATPFEDIQFYQEPAKTRGMSPESWTEYEIIQPVGDDYYSYGDAAVHLEIMTNSRTPGTVDGDTRASLSVNVSILPNGVQQFNGQEPGPAADKSAQDQQGNMVLLKEVDLNALMTEKEDSKELLKHLMEMSIS